MKNDELPTRAEEMFCHAIYTASHVVNRAYAPMLTAMGLTYPQYITLTLLWENDNQTVSGLAQQVAMQTSTMTPLVKRLEMLGLIIRNRSKQDERKVFVELTDTGRAMQAKAPEVTECIVAGTTLSHAELDQLQSLLAKLRSGFTAQQS